MDLDDKPVHLVIKSPDQNISDQTIDCILNWTVGKLKNELSKVYPSKPIPEKQKLIYSGQVLQNDSMLKDVLRLDESNDTHILHLVCNKSKESVQNGRLVSEHTETVLNADNDGERTNATLTTDERTESHLDSFLNRVVHRRTRCEFNVHITRERHYSEPARPVRLSSHQMDMTDCILLGTLLLLSFLLILLVAHASGAFGNIS